MFNVNLDLKTQKIVPFAFSFYVDTTTLTIIAIAEQMTLTGGAL